MTAAKSLRIATRHSNLAIWQAKYTAQALQRQHPGLEVQLVELTTTGDVVLSQPLRTFGGMGVFTREIQSAVLDGRADIAVHSLKDLPTEPHPDLVLAAVLERGPTADAVVLPAHTRPGLEPLPLSQGARVATGSPRRQAQLLHSRPDLVMSEVRGNVETRLRKLDAGEFDAMILACAGLIRLGLGQRISRALAPPVMYHAVGQGAIGIECRRDDVRTQALLAAIEHEATACATRAERALLAKLRAGCHAPVGVASTITGSRLQLQAVVLTLDGRQRWEATATAELSDCETVGIDVAEDLLRQGAQVSAE